MKKLSILLTLFVPFMTLGGYFLTPYAAHADETVIVGKPIIKKDKKDGKYQSQPQGSVIINARKLAQF